MSVQSIVTDALMGMIAAIASAEPPKDVPPPPFIQAAIDRASERITAGLPKHSKAVADVLAERYRQVHVEGFDASYDDMATRGQLGSAAACYAFAAPKHEPTIRKFWPWDWVWFKPRDQRQDLVRAGALIIAEIERLDRAAMRGEQA